MIATILGWLLILTVLLDVFLTVLYARVGAGIISRHLACAMWRVFRAVGKPFPRRRDMILSLCGPSILVALVAVWIGGVMTGGALIIYPRLGTSVVANDGQTPTDFITALYISGDAMTTVGTSDISPRTGAIRMLYTMLSLLGISILTLTLTYYLEVYNALQQRNNYAVKLHHGSDDTGDAAELLAGVGPQGQFQAGYAHLMEMATETITLFEAHHFYAVLMYFRFREPSYALSRMTLMTLDTVTLIKSTLDDREYAWVKESAAVTQMWRSSMNMLTELSVEFLPGGMPEEPAPPAEHVERWRRRYRIALDRLRQAGIKTIADEREGEENYVALRARWDRYLHAFAEHMAHPIEQIDPVLADPRGAVERPEFAQRLRAAG